MRHRPLQILLVEDNADDADLIQSALAELAEGRYWGVWSGRFEMFHVEELGEALALMHDVRFDVILLDSALRGTQPLPALLALSRKAPDSVVIFVAAIDDEPLAAQLIRAGAEDWLIKTELDCIPLARAVRHAIERGRVRAALRSISFRDELTGLYNRSAFHQVAGHSLGLVERLDANLILMRIDLDASEDAPSSERSLALIETADLLRSHFGEPSVLARLEESRFAVLRVDVTPFEMGAEIDRLLDSLLMFNRGRRSAEQLGLRLGASQSCPLQRLSLDALLAAAEPLCENGPDAAAAANLNEYHLIE